MDEVVSVGLSSVSPFPVNASRAVLAAVPTQARLRCSSPLPTRSRGCSHPPPPHHQHHGSARMGLSQLGSLGWGVISPLSISPHPAAVHPGEGSSSIPAASAPLGLCLAFLPPAPSFWLSPNPSAGFNASCVPPPPPSPGGQESLGPHQGPGQSHHFGHGHGTSPARSEVSPHVGGRVLAKRSPPRFPRARGRAVAGKARG